MCTVPLNTISLFIIRLDRNIDGRFYKLCIVRIQKMMSGNNLLVFIVTLMSVIDYSYLIVNAVVLPNIEDTSFEKYRNWISESQTEGKMLDEDQFKRTLENYKIYKDEINNTFLYKQIQNLFSEFTDEIATLTKIISIEGCGKSLEANMEKYIKERQRKQLENSTNKEERQKEQLEKERQKEQLEDSTNKEERQKEQLEKKRQKEQFEKIKSITQLEKDEITLDPKEDKFNEEITYLKTLIPMSNNTGRIKNLLLNTQYGNSENKKNKSDDSLRSVWFFLLKKLDPMFGESYMSYAIRMTQQKKMPLPLEYIPVFYGKENAKLYLHEKFDIWPELNSAFVMYYLFHCPFEPSIPSPITSQEESVKATQPI